jgi:exopolyphosphatase / guanosine-5'-triphosphate,3'-diphosphate pyrophosphatase
VPKKAARPPLPRLAAIDIGSNAMRMVVAELGTGYVLKPLKSLRSPVRLGQDVFRDGHISAGTLKKAVRALQTFREWMQKLAVTQSLAVGTAATREAQNQRQFLDLVRRDAGIELQVLPGEEEARMVYLAVHRRLPLGDRSVLVIDIGGGSVELIFGRSGQVQALESLKMGTVRMLTRLSNEEDVAPQDFLRRAREYVDATRGWVDYCLQEHGVELLVGTGGNAEELGRLGQKVFGKPSNDQLTAGELDQLMSLLESLSVEERKKKLGLRSDRADVIVPAALVLQTLMRQTGAQVLLIPHVGLKDGLLEELRFQALGQRPDGLDREQVMSSVVQLGRKYDFDEPHARKVADLSLQLFDQLQQLHKLGPQHRMLLEAAALLHDIGKFISFSAHHKHSQYLIAATPMVGLSHAHRKVVAAVARYHRKSPPNLQHEFYRELALEDRQVVARLSALLRLAEALDAEHGGMVEQLSVQTVRNKVLLTIQGRGDLLLERWSAAHKTELFDKALGAKLVLAK